jgi:hypothetical protein
MLVITRPFLCISSRDFYQVASRVNGHFSTKSVRQPRASAQTTFAKGDESLDEIQNSGDEDEDDENEG